VPVVEPRILGPWGIRKKILSLPRRSAQPFRISLYEPLLGDINAAIPVVVISHGLAANPQAMDHYARHLASHGYLFAVPQHPGSGTHQVRHMLPGTVDEVFSLQEFVDRPHDVSTLLDKLERLYTRDYDGRFNLTAVGILGESLRNLPQHCYTR
jgi:predicted dienelactone hydrolase